MTSSGKSISTNALGRIGLWFCSLLVSVTLFSYLFSLFLGGPGSFRVESVYIVLRVTTMLALPIWCLCLPLVIALTHSEGWRMWTVLTTGTLIGPASFALWGLILLRRGDDPHSIWHGDPLLCGLGGVGSAMVFALIVGSLTTSFYLFALKAFSEQSAASR